MKYTSIPCLECVKLEKRYFKGMTHRSRRSGGGMVPKRIVLLLEELCLLMGRDHSVLLRNGESHILPYPKKLRQLIVSKWCIGNQ